MQFSSRLSIAVHMLLCIEKFHKERKVTSTFLAESVNVNPVIIRKTMGQLQKAGLVKVEAGIGGATLTMPLKNITLGTVFHAVEPEEMLFSFHNPNTECPVGANIHKVLDPHLMMVQQAVEVQLDCVTLADMMKGIK